MNSSRIAAFAATLTVLGVVLIVATLSFTRKEVNEVQEIPVYTEDVLFDSEVKEDTVVVETKETVKNKRISVRTINASNVVILNTQVTETSVEATINSLQSAGDTVYLIIDSPGGSVFAGAKLINHIKYSSQEIITVCEGVCASMGFHIFESGKRRIMQDKAMLMGHPASGQARGTIDEMLTLLNAIKVYTERMDRYIAKRANIPYDKFQLMNLKNMWIESVDAVEMGLADEVAYVNYDRALGSNTISIRDLIKTKEAKRGTDKIEFNW